MATLDPTEPVPGNPGTVDVHRRAYWLTQQGKTEAEAYEIAVRELVRYRQLARCDRCAVLKEVLHPERDHTGKTVVCCRLCRQAAGW